MAMKLQTINKARYRQHLNRLLIASAASLMLGALVISTLLIALLGAQLDSNFSLNLTGVVISGFSITWALNHFKNHPWMTEIFYVWQLKKQLNLISRKITKLEQQLELNNPTAMLVLNYYYQGSMQLWQLDDNTITLDSLNRKIAILSQRLADNNISVSSDDYDSSLLNQF